MVDPNLQLKVRVLIFKVKYSKKENFGYYSSTVLSESPKQASLEAKCKKTKQKYG